MRRRLTIATVTILGLAAVWIRLSRGRRSADRRRQQQKRRRRDCERLMLPPTA